MDIINREGDWRLYGADTPVGRYLADELGHSAPAGRRVAYICTDRDDTGDARGVSAGELERVLAELEADLPAQVIYLSSHRVYSEDAGEGVDESRPTFGRTATGRAFLKAERRLTDWASARGVTLTVGRAAAAFGEGISGDMAELFNRVINGRYIHVRGNEAKLSAVTSLDAARALRSLAGKPGTFNISDGNSYTWVSLAEAMTANAGAQKRMTHLPEKWVKWINRLFGRLPIVAETLGPEALAPFSRTLTLDNSRLVEATGMTFHNTLEVIARRDKTYPYRS